jgi:HEAT repeat protein
VSCGGSGSDGDTNESPYDGLVSADTALEVAEAFDPAEPDTVLALNDVVAAGSDDAVPDLLALLNDEDANRQWAGLYLALLLTDSEDEIELLRPLLTHEEPVFRAMAAGTLAGLGEVESLAVLVEALASDADLPYSDPPRRLADYARIGLEALTGEEFADASGWERWWQEAEGNLTWDGEGYVAR